MTIKIKNIGELATYDVQQEKVLRKKNIEILIQGQNIIGIGKNLGSTYQEIDAQGSLVTPGFVDPHTHPVFAVTREKEFEMRIQGKSYQEIAESGGGILSSVQSLRKIVEEELEKRVEERMRDFLALGTTTVEAKSGYGLSTDSELKSLRVLKNVSKNVELEIIPTFLGAHDFPEDYRDNRQAYIDLVCQEMIPAVREQGIAQFCDVFCEEGWFSKKESRQILTTAKKYGFRIRLHADEFSDSGGAGLAGDLKAVSADHLTYSSISGIQKMAKEGVIAILLPATTFFLGKSKYAPARKFLEEGVKIALATDFNPGSSMTQSMPFVMTLACLYLGMTVDEAFLGATYHAACSLCLGEKVGSLEVGKQADIIIWNIKTLSEIPYWFGVNKIRSVLKCGKFVFGSS